MITVRSDSSVEHGSKCLEECAPRESDEQLRGLVFSFRGPRRLLFAHPASTPLDPRRKHCDNVARPRRGRSDKLLRSCCDFDYVRTRVPDLQQLILTSRSTRQGKAGRAAACGADADVLPALRAASR